MANGEKAVKEKKTNRFQRGLKKIVDWVRGTKSELKKVVWLSKKQVITNTVVAIVVIVISAVVVWAFDEIAAMAVNLLISIAR